MPSVSQVIYPVPDYPRQIRLDTTCACNAKCPSCHRWLSKRSGEMSKSMVQEIIEDISKWDEPLNEIVPVNYGEFFLYKDWYWLLQLIAEKLPATRIVIPTNGSVVDRRVVEKLCTIPNIDIINFSVNAFFDETYTQFMGFSPEVLENIFKMIKLMGKKRPDISLWTSMVFSPTYHTDLEKDLFYEAWQGLAYPQIITASSAGRGYQPLHPVKLPCRSLFSDFVIGFDGKLSSCCWDSSFSLDMGTWSGDIKKDWHNDKLNEIRNLHNEGKRDEIQLCKVCGYA